MSDNGSVAPVRESNGLKSTSPVSAFYRDLRITSGLSVTRPRSAAARFATT
jgi:hypothetical protein